MTHFPFTLRRLFLVMAVFFSLLLGGAFARHDQRIEPYLTADGKSSGFAEAQATQKPASAPVASRLKKKIAGSIAARTNSVRFLRRRKAADSSHPAVYLLSATRAFSLLTVLPSTCALVDQPTFVCYGMAAASWGLPDLLLSRTDRVTN
jgi:hypothetical protein